MGPRRELRTREAERKRFGIEASRKRIHREQQKETETGSRERERERERGGWMGNGGKKGERLATLIKASPHHPCWKKMKKASITQVRSVHAARKI